MSTLYRRGGSKNWMMAVTIAGKQVCKSTHTKSKPQAKQMLFLWERDIFEGRFHLPKSTPPYFQDYADDFQTRAPHAMTRKRYESSIKKLKQAFSGIRLTELSAEQIDDYKKGRLAEGVQPATINHD